MPVELFLTYLFLYALISIWFLLLLNIFLTISGYIFYKQIEKNKFRFSSKSVLQRYPYISILVPAHNEEKVIAKTVEAIFNLDYPNEQMELIVINDLSDDNTLSILENMRDKYNKREFKIISTTKENGKKGKANVLNIGLKQAKGEYIVIYDADNIPERFSLRYLVQTIEENNDYGAVIGKFRVINKERNWLTRFINIETISFQWLSQAGRWNLLRLCTIPGTNFIIRKRLLEELNGWDNSALAEDTELSFRIYRLGYKIAFMPLAVSWEQEPEIVGVWLRQRTRWVVGNIYVIIKNLKQIFFHREGAIWFDLIYFYSVYFFFFSAIVLSDIIFLFLLITKYQLLISNNLWLIWFLSIILYVMQINITLNLEKGEGDLKNLLRVFVMYFTYSQLWLIAMFKGIYSYMKLLINKSSFFWDKTERF